MTTYGAIPNKEPLAVNNADNLDIYVDPDSKKPTLASPYDSKEDDPNQKIQQDPILARIIKLSKLIVPFFVILAIICVVLTVLGAISILTQISAVFEILLCALIGSSAGALGVYKFGTMEEQIERLSGENSKYEGELGKLRSTTSRLKTEVTSVQASVGGLEKSVDEYQEQLKGFEPLKDELKSVHGDNQEIHDLLESTNRLFDDMSRIAIQNEKAHLLSIYYECEFRDSSDGMSKDEYIRFLGRLSKPQRLKFEKLGTFEELAGADGIIDVQEFQQILSKFLETTEEELIQASLNT